MAGLITMGLGAPQTLITMGLGGAGIEPPEQIIKTGGGVSFKRRIYKREEEEEKYVENWIIEISGININIYSKTETKIDMKPNIFVKLSDIDIEEDKSDNDFSVQVEDVRIAIE